MTYIEETISTSEQSNTQFRPFYEPKNIYIYFFNFHTNCTVAFFKDPSIHASFSYCCSTDIKEARVISILGSTSAQIEIEVKIQIQPFLKENPNFGVSML